MFAHRVLDGMTGRHQRGLEDEGTSWGKAIDLGFQDGGFLSLFLGVEAVCRFEMGDHVVLFSDNQSAVS